MLFKLAVPLGALAVFTASASAQALSYAQSQVQVRCGILLLDSTVGPGGQPTNADPYVFYNLDRRTDVKPAGWNFVNPMAPGSVTPAIQARWDAIYGGVGPFVSGDKLRKNMAPYWEVRLSQASSSDLGRYDVLMIHAPGNINLNSSEREKLRIFIDQGGILWFDKAATQTVDGFNGFPVPFSVLSNVGSNPFVQQPQHPILNYPHKLGYFEAAFMGATGGSHAIIRTTLASLGLAAYADVFSTMEPDFDRINPVVTNTVGIALGVAPVGNGFMVLSSTNITSRINEPAGGTNFGGLGQNSGPLAGENMNNIPQTELKFVYNMIALQGGHPGLAKGSRRLNSSFDDIGAPLLEVWNHPTLPAAPGNETVYRPPAIYKGLVFVSAGNTLYAYKAETSRDLDGDGLSDDGFQDISIGATQDLVWQSTPMAQPLSSPVCVEAANAVPGLPHDQVYVVDGNGVLRIFNALPKDAQGRLLGNAPIAPVQSLPNPTINPAVVDTGLNGHGPYPVVSMEGLVYVYDTYQSGLQRLGRVWTVNSATLGYQQSGVTPWVAAGSGAPNLPEAAGAPTIGYIPNNDGSGGFDKVMYVANRSSLAGSPVGVSSLWVGVRGEAPTITAQTAVSVDLLTRCASKGLRIYNPGGSTSYGVRVYLVDSVGTPFTPVQTATYLDGSVTEFVAGQLRLGLNLALPAGTGVRLDYHIDWGRGNPNFINQVIRGQLFMPDDISRNRYMQKSMALAANGNLFVTCSNELNNGSLFCVKEFQRGQFELIYRWDLHDGFNILLNGSTTVRIPSAIQDRDDLYPSLGFNYPTLRRLHFHGAPVIIGDVCYMTAMGDQFGVIPAFPFPIRASYVLAFDASPSRTDIRLGGPSPAGLKMRQPDIATSSNKNTPEKFVALQANMFDDDGSGLLRFSNMMSATSGVMQNGFSSSTPVIISGNGVPEYLFDPNTTGSKWSPLLWYFGINGFTNDSPPLVMGNTLYVAGASILPDVMGGSFPPVARGALFAMDATIPKNDPSIITIAGYPGLKQVRWFISDASPLGFHSNDHVRWPSGQGVTSLNDFRVRLNQTLLNNGAVNGVAYGIIGGDGTIVSWANSGIFAFQRATTLIADEGRVIETDSGGFAKWSSDLSYDFMRSYDAATNTYGPTEWKPSKLVRPTKAYKTTPSEIVAVDTGGNRIAIIDKSAGEIRSIEKLILDTTYRPGGWVEGSVPELRQPRDVSVWFDYVPAANNPMSGALPMEYWVHYLIADTGNRRMIELVDRYASNPATFTVGNVVLGPGNVRQLGVLYWHTPIAFTGKTWQYSAIQRFQIGAAGGNAQFVYVAALGDMMPTRVNTGLDVPDGTGQRENGGGAGGMVIYDAVNGDQVINEVTVPAVGPGVLSIPAAPAYQKKLIGISSVSVRPIGINGNFIDYAIMFTDVTGVYEIQNIGGTWQVIWMLPNDVYKAVRNGGGLRATSAKRLANGQVLVCNAWTGPVGGVTVSGEVTQWLGNTFGTNTLNLGFSINTLKMNLPPIVGARGLRSPQFADRY